MVVGGTSDIALGALALLSRRRLRAVVLASRNAERLAAAAAELRELGIAEVHTIVFDVTDPTTHAELVADCARALGTIDLVLIAAGALGPAELDELDSQVVAGMFAANCSGPAGAAAELARAQVSQGFGRIVVLSSVAGVRTRRSNFVYGAAKAGLDGFSLGLSDLLAGTGVEVTVVRPGFVRSKMTAGMTEAPLSSDVGTVAAAVVRALETGASVVWVPTSLRFVFAGLRLLPRSVWRRLPG